AVGDPGRSELHVDLRQRRDLQPVLRDPAFLAIAEVDLVARVDLFVVIAAGVGELSAGDDLADRAVDFRGDRAAGRIRRANAERAATEREDLYPIADVELVRWCRG